MKESERMGKKIEITIDVSEKVWRRSKRELAEGRAETVDAQGQQCRAAAGPACAAVRGEERGALDLAVRPRGPEIRRRSGGATGSIGRGPADLVRERSGAGTQRRRAGRPWRAPPLGPRRSVLGLWWSPD
ncbi:hypothetical protein NDU88_000976 [Pleurodeles waltl]|uniref:Uncharacterized protein n=1 Tax=Pleurodeles waltl TaxID=8319 RepID=A0AAV7VYH4_PLEWA|nr:hypothetical protein NDU88_000976 [Pleurodeles waltl]